MSNPANSPTAKVTRRESFWAMWAVVAAFGTYFCMYGFRKPFTAAEYVNAEYWGIGFKTLVVSIQVVGYMLSKFIGIKVISEMPPRRRALAILILICGAELGLAVFGMVPRPWNSVGLFINGLALGMVFGLVLGFLEGRRMTEALVAGLCASFILADGVTKSVGRWLLESGVAEDWMPFTAGLIYALPLCLCLAMLSVVPPPSNHDVISRSRRYTMSRKERWELFWRYAPGLSLLVGIYLLITVMRSVRADFAPELWRQLGKPAAPETFTYSEMIVALAVMLANGLAVFIGNNRVAFFASLVTCGCGFLFIAGTLLGQQAGMLTAFPFMVLIGFGLYLPYVAMHTTVFERLLAVTREKGNLGFLMYLADAIGYLGYVMVMVCRNLLGEPNDFLQFFMWLCWIAAGLSIVFIAFSWFYFSERARENPRSLVAESI